MTTTRITLFCFYTFLVYAFIFTANGICSNLEQNYQLSSRRYLTKKQKRKKKSRRPRPNAKILYDETPLLDNPSAKSNPVLLLPEGAPIRITDTVKDNYVKVFLFKNKKKYIGWVYLENIYLSKSNLKDLKKPSENSTDALDESTEQKKTQSTPVNYPTKNRPLEKTLILNPGVSLVSWHLNFMQEKYETEQSLLYQDVTRSHFSASLDIQFSITQSINLFFGIPYRFYDKKKTSSVSDVSTYKTKGLGDLYFGFAKRILSQVNYFDLLLLGTWHSGFMSHDLPTPEKTGGAGSGSHDIELGLVIAKAFSHFSPYLEFSWTMLGSTTRHLADDSYSEKYDKTYEFNYQLGCEFPQMLPHLLARPSIFYKLKKEQKVHRITAPEKDYTIDPIKKYGVNLDLFFYRRSAYIFQYSYEITKDYVHKLETRKKLNKHNFSIGLRF